MDSDIQKHCLAAVVLHIILLHKIRFRLSYFCVISYVLHSHKYFKEWKADNTLQENRKEELARYTNASVSSVCSLPWLFKVIFNIIKIIFHFRLSWCQFLISHKMVIFSFLLETKQLLRSWKITVPFPRKKGGQGSPLPAAFQLNLGVGCFKHSVHTVVTGNYRWWRSDSERLRDLYASSQGRTPLRQRAKPTELAFILLLLTLYHKVL